MTSTDFVLTLCRLRHDHAVAMTAAFCDIHVILLDIWYKQGVFLHHCKSLNADDYNKKSHYECLGNMSEVRFFDYLEWFLIEIIVNS